MDVGDTGDGASTAGCYSPGHSLPKPAATRRSNCQAPAAGTGCPCAALRWPTACRLRLHGCVCLCVASSLRPVCVGLHLPTSTYMYIHVHTWCMHPLLFLWRRCALAVSSIAPLARPACEPPRPDSGSSATAPARDFRPACPPAARPLRYLPSPSTIMLPRLLCQNATVTSRPAQRPPVPSPFPFCQCSVSRLASRVRNAPPSIPLSSILSISPPAQTCRRPSMLGRATAESRSFVNCGPASA